MSRSFIGIFCLLVGGLLTLERYLVLELLRFFRRRGRNFRSVLISGVGPQAIQLVAEIGARPELGIRIRGIVDLTERRDSEDRSLAEFRLALRKMKAARVGRIFRGEHALERALLSYAIDEVIFCDVVNVMPSVQRMVELCTEQGIRTTLTADFFSMGMLQSQMSFFAGIPLIHFQPPPGDPWQLAVKRSVDIVVSATLLVLLAPVFLIIALAIRMGSPGPVLFRQRRVGLHGSIFTLFKFRSMEVNAEDRLQELLPHNEMKGPVFKLRNDPRVTKVGKFLRRFSLDELPQLWNVLRGDMSLVGPRPPVPDEVSLYERCDRRRLSMRPGLTCTWQVSGRNNIEDFESWVEMDLEYIDNWSLRRDMFLLFRTVPAVLLGTGAR
jgi:exopolysaccharide biosynthesis polyprenyl glycosylphosphotransferase